MASTLNIAADIAVNKCLGIKPSDKVLVIADTALEKIGRLFFDAALKCAPDTQLLIITPRKTHAEEPPEQIAKLMLGYDVLIIPTYRSMTHTDARRAACNAGARCATLPNVQIGSIRRAINANYDRIAKLSNRYAKILTDGKTARVTTPAGTDISFSIDGRDGFADTGLALIPGMFTNLPAGEAYIAPIEGTANGRIVIDGAICDTGKLAQNDFIYIDVKDGYATDITGGKSAEELRALIEPFGIEAKNVAELGIGTNYKARICGCILEDEKVLGTVHIALGDNKSMGGNVRVASHLDGILMSPTLYIDDKIVMRDGKGVK
jgi:leucyl aminopeptidase (aminopeptidase T)